ncbi:MAG: helix-turn-helix domain-containing protein [Mesorhizobium sp.]|nr:helix-turn-helix transcriptional regulator [Mesorhizobium sp.]MBN9243423.1 helix-turn-helix domain-containing protein [Mesorhizobium sp.]
MEIFRDWEDIKAALHRRGMTFTKLAPMYGLDPSACRVAKSRTHRKAEAAIADFLGVPVEKLFPDRYPIRTARILSSKYDDAVASQKSLAPSDTRAAA